MVPKANQSLQTLTTLQVGGAAEYFVAVKSLAEVASAVEFAQSKSLPVYVLGGGSNVLVPDEGVVGIVVQIAIENYEVTEDGGDVLLTVGAGEVFDEVVAKTVAAGWWGLENLSHIPGSVGATPVQNVGAYGVEVKDVIESVEVFDCQSKTSRTLSSDECGFGYRDSIFKHEAGKNLIVTGVTFRLSKASEPNITYKDLTNYFTDSEPTLAEVRTAVIEIRSKKFPDWHAVGTAGSFFKNPIISAEKFASLKTKYPELPGFVLSDGRVKLPLGWVLDKVCHLKGVREGTVGTYEEQALVLINHGDATAAEITSFAEKVTTHVKEKTDLDIEWEVTRW